MSGPPQPGDTLVAAALKVIREPDPWAKAAHTKEAVSLWQSGAISKCVGTQTPYLCVTTTLVVGCTAADCPAAPVCQKNQGVR